MAGERMRRARLDWRLPRGVLRLGERTLVMGIVNVTPDSFSDGGRYNAAETAVRRGLELLDEGADLLDVGAESTRPGAVPIGAEEETARLLPVLRELRRVRPEAVMSVDTYHARTAMAAVEAGADVINDVSGLLWDEGMAEVLARAEPAPGVVLMHTRGRPGEWAGLPGLQASEVVLLVREGLRERMLVAERAGIAAERVMVDPGFGFGKRGEENMALLAGLGELSELGRPLLAGISRKGFLMTRGRRSREAGDAAGRARLEATIAGNTAAVLEGAHMLRVHDVTAAMAAVEVGDRLLRAGELRG